MNDRCELARCGGSWAILPAILAVCAVLTPASAVEIADKTLVAWVSPANLTQGGGSVLTLENPPGQFDAIVLGEIGRARWMAGSEGFRRTQREQGANPVVFEVLRMYERPRQLGVRTATAGPAPKVTGHLYDVWIESHVQAGLA